jgi:hypothetical protein
MKATPIAPAPSANMTGQALKKRVGIAARQVELADKEVRHHHNNDYDNGRYIAQECVRCFADENKHNHRAKS